MSEETFSFNTPTTEIPFPTSFVSSGTLPAFNTALGTLMGVDFVLGEEDTAAIDIYNTNSTSQDFNFASYSAGLSVTANGGTSVSESPSFTLTSGGVANSGPGDTQFAGSAEFATSMEAISNADLSFYEGNSSKTIPVTVTFTETAPNALISGQGPGVFAGGEVDASTGLTVEYFYQAVPEPATWALFGFALAALGLCRTLAPKRAKCRI